MKEYKRNCPICNNEIIYKTSSAFNDAIRKNKRCKQCANKSVETIIGIFKRNCPICNKELEYCSLNKLNRAKKNNTLCKSCSGKKKADIRFEKARLQKEETIKYLKQDSNKFNNDTHQFIRNCPICNKQLFFNNYEAYKKSENNKSKCLSCAIKIVQSDPNMKLRLKEKCRIASLGKNNPMYGKSVYDVWIKKYGKDIANKKLNELKKKQSINSSGKNNPMYGKNVPKGVGNGWSGHYLGYYFRSLLELSYLKYLLDNNIKFENGEQKKFFIDYKLDGNDRIYRPDYYLTNTQEIIEIKPKKLINIKENKLKFEAARIKYKDKFKILTENEIENIPLNVLYNLYLVKDIIFDLKYESKFIDLCKKRGIINE